MNPKELEKLKTLWYQHLKKDGFEDIEYSNGNIKTYDYRNQTYQNRGLIFEFFYFFEHYINDHPEIPEPDQKILRLYVQGIFITEIALILELKLWEVKKLIKKYKNMIKLEMNL